MRSNALYVIDLAGLYTKYNEGVMTEYMLQASPWYLDAKYKPIQYCEHDL